MITSEDVELARQVIKNMATAFEDLVQICKSLDKSDQRRIFPLILLVQFLNFLQLEMDMNQEFQVHNSFRANDCWKLLKMK